MSVPSSSNAVPLKCWPFTKICWLPCGILRGGVAPANHFLRAGGEELERGEVAVHDRQVFHVLLVELDGDVGAIGLELVRFRGYFDLLRGGPNGELAVDPLIRVSGQRNVLETQ